MALQIDGDCLFGEQVFLDAVWGAVTKLYGEYGASLASLALISFDVERRLAVLRVNLMVVDEVRAALVTLTSIGSCSCAVHVVAVSGTIKGLRRNLAD